MPALLLAGNEWHAITEEGCHNSALEPLPPCMATISSPRLRFLVLSRFQGVEQTV